VTIGFGFDGSTAEKNVDWDGDLKYGTVTVSLMVFSNGVNSYGEKVVAYSAINDNLDEPTEFIHVTVNGASANTRAALTTPVPFVAADALVTSGDYKFENVLHGTAGGGYGSAELVAFEHWRTTIGTDNTGFPTTERSIGVKVYEGGNPKVGLAVQLVRKTVSAEGVVVKVLNNNGAEDNSATATTGGDGVAYFTIRYKSGDFNQTQNFEARFTNGEGIEQDATISVRIVNNG
jgi:hypothetical protein